MKKTAAIFHGLGGSEKSYWIPWLKDSLETKNFDVWTPSLSACEEFDELDKWVQEVAATTPHYHYDLMVGHSAGGPLILRLLSRNDFTASHVVSVAGFIQSLPENLTGDLTDDPTYPPGLDIHAIKNNCRHLTYIHSDNDPWACGQEQGEYMRRNLGGTLVVMTGEGHFGSDYMKQPYEKFPLLLQHCLLET